MCVSSSNNVLFNSTIQGHQWKTLMKEKEMKEAAKKTNLINEKTQIMNQEETARENVERKKLQSLLKETMKKVASRRTDEKDEQVQQEPMKNGKKKKAGNKRKPNVKEKLCEKDARASKATRKTKKGKQQVGRTIPEATDKHGCKHKGLLDLKVLPSDYLSNYMKEGGWLWNVQCKDCAKRDDSEENDGTEMGLSGLMPKKGKKDVGYYCNCGPTGHDMEDEHPYKEIYTCDLVLCMGCYDKRKERMGRTSRRRK